MNASDGLDYRCPRLPGPLDKCDFRPYRSNTVRCIYCDLEVRAPRPALKSYGSWLHVQEVRDIPNEAGFPLWLIPETGKGVPAVVAKGPDGCHFLQRGDERLDIGQFKYWVPRIPKAKDAAARG